MTEKEAVAELERVKKENGTTINEEQLRIFGGGA
jgi:hypothetical protein